MALRRGGVVADVRQPVGAEHGVGAESRAVEVGAVQLVVLDLPTTEQLPKSSHLLAPLPIFGAFRPGGQRFSIDQAWTIVQILVVQRGPPGSRLS